MGHNRSDNFAGLQEITGPRNIRLMRRCFMTGKQCIFSSHITECAKKELTQNDFKTFVVMPFEPNLETFYLWRLKPYLLKNYGLVEDNVQRADEVRDIGYIVCEKICRKIQESDLVIADVSLNNANVFYEIGLAYGLMRPIALMQNGNSNQKVLEDKCFQQSMGVEKDTYVKYPGIEELSLDREEQKLHRNIILPQGNRIVEKSLQINFLCVERDECKNNSYVQPQSDIHFNFMKVVSAAVDVAMSEIRSDLEKERDDREKTGIIDELEPWKKAVLKIKNNGPKSEWVKFAQAEPIIIDGRGDFNKISKQIESSFCTIIDVSENEPISCFWLGYCHAKGLNVIPVFKLPPEGDTKTPSGEKNPINKRKSKLAFDIRALWYAEYESDKPYKFKVKVKEIIEHLFERDLPDRQKRIFWNRFPAERKLKVFTGAIHNKELNREMVGDWDVRTVSELFSYLPTVREASATELVTPLYSPEEAYRRLGKQKPKTKDTFISNFNFSLEEQLKNSSAIVIASPDVNPVAEYLLHKICDVKNPIMAFKDCEKPEFDGYVIIKKDKKKSFGRQNTKFGRLFFRTEEQDKSTRGFGKHLYTRNHEIPELMETYLSQDQCDREFSLLGQLVVSKYPPQKESPNYIILLNGVSGPATFALAQILTGGVLGNQEMKTRSEQMLYKINDVLDEDHVIGVQAIVKVQIRPHDYDGGAQARSRTYEDSRQVASWEFVKEPERIMSRALRLSAKA
ncbi:MAG: hypothetical protein P8X96_08120 [Desulfobacteraceae bacterium]